MNIEFQKLLFILFWPKSNFPF